MALLPCTEAGLECDTKCTTKGNHALLWSTSPPAMSIANKTSVLDIDVKGKRVVIRVDFNVPIKDGKVRQPMPAQWHRQHLRVAKPIRVPM